jgi:putative membrane protein
MENVTPGPAPDDAEDGSEPDVRFTFANERTLLAWSRTALGLIVAGLAIVQLLPPFAGLPWGRHLLAIPLILLGAVLPGGAYLEWRRNQRALRHGRPLPRSSLPRLLVVVISGVAVAATALIVVPAS